MHTYSGENGWLVSGPQTPDEAAEQSRRFERLQQHLEDRSDPWEVPTVTLTAEEIEEDRRALLARANDPVQQAQVQQALDRIAKQFGGGR